MISKEKNINYKSRHSIDRIFLECNHSTGEQLRRASELFKGEFFLIVDAHTRLHANHVDRLIATACSFPECKAAYSQAYRVENGSVCRRLDPEPHLDAISTVSVPSHQVSEALLRRFEELETHLIKSSILFERSILEEISPDWLSGIQSCEHLFLLAVLNKKSNLREVTKSTCIRSTYIVAEAEANAIQHLYPYRSYSQHQYHPHLSSHQLLFEAWIMMGFPLTCTNDLAALERKYDKLRNRGCLQKEHGVLRKEYDLTSLYSEIEKLTRETKKKNMSLFKKILRESRRILWKVLRTNPSFWSIFSKS
jgi:hypothetical protein